MLDLRKRTSQVMTNLDILFPRGNLISVEKKKDLLDLMAYIPPIHHDFFKNLQTSSTAADSDIHVTLEDEEFNDL